MKRTLFFGSLFVVSIMGSPRLCAQEPTKTKEQLERVPYEYLVDEINSLSRLLFQLAAERYAATSNRSENWIFTVHEGRTVRKFSDGRFVLVSLPLFQPTDTIAVRRYAAHYNAFNIQFADRLAKAGNYKKARELYELVRHFDPTGVDFTRDQLDKKLAYLRKLENREDTTKNLKELLALSEEIGPLVDFTMIDKLAPTTVTNLTSIRLP
jgi:hypothetical protein